MTLKLFDHLNAIYTNKRIDYFDALDEADKKTYEPYMVNRFLSMNPDYINIVNEVNKYYGIIGARESYLFYSQLLPRGKQFNKYVKGEKMDKYEEWLTDVIVKHYNVSTNEAHDYLTIFYLTDENKSDLRTICEQYAIEPKQLKKIGL